MASAQQQRRWAQAEREFERRATPRDGELGRTPLFGLMPDWNTAELLGEHPRPLAASLFAALIADTTWRHARINLGYRRSPVHPLLAMIAGRPYVDVRASLNSLVPDGISDAMARVVIEAGMHKLRLQPELHDRVETELFPTCMGFADEDLAQLKHAGLSAVERRNWHTALLAMEANWQQFSAHGSTIDETASATDLPTALRSIKTCLALPFAMHARLAFVARFQLASLVTAGALSQKRLDQIFATLAVVNSRTGVAARGAGLLRPATFDIRVQPVGNVLINTASANAAKAKAKPIVALSGLEHRLISQCLRPLNLGVDAYVWLALALRRIELRELQKYRLSLAVSTWLSALTAWGERRDLSVDDVSFLTIKNIAKPAEPSALRRIISRNQQRYAEEAAIKMPLLLAGCADIRANSEPALRPTFVGSGRVLGALRSVDRHARAERIAAGTVVLIRATDPGFDWIFVHPLVALVTCYGGPHSHMAIRCAELGVPCVLGCGETTFNALSVANGVTIDFDLGQMTVNA